MKLVKVRYSFQENSENLEKTVWSLKNLTRRIGGAEMKEANYKFNDDHNFILNIAWEKSRGLGEF